MRGSFGKWPWREGWNMLTPQERTIPARNPRIQVSSIHILDDESETSTFKYSYPKKINRKIPPLNVMAMFFFPTTNTKNNKSESLIFWVPLPPTPRSDRPLLPPRSVRCQAPVFPAAFQPSCWGGAAILAKPKMGEKTGGAKSPKTPVGSGGDEAT